MVTINIFQKKPNKQKNKKQIETRTFARNESIPTPYIQKHRFSIFGTELLNIENESFK